MCARLLSSDWTCIAAGPWQIHGAGADAIPISFRSTYGMPPWYGRVTLSISRFLADVLLPVEEVHLLAGPSGAGKTRWLMHNLLLWEEGADFLGYHSHPVPWVYVAADRTVISVERTLLSMGIEPGRINAIPAWDKGMSIGAIMDAIKDSGARLAVWESFGSFVEPPGNGKTVKEFILRMSKFCRQEHVTIIGVVESPKMKPYERYENPRQRVSGAAAWGHFSETIFLVEPDAVENPNDPYRNLFVCPRNAPGLTILLSFDIQGRLLPIQEDDVIEMLNKRKTARKSLKSR